MPLLGPSNPRDTFAYAAEVFFNPFFWLDYFETDFVTLGVGSYRVLHQRAQADEQIEGARESALDFYVFARDAYTSRREAQVRNEEIPEPGSGNVPDDLYDDVYDDPDAGEEASDDAGNSP